MWTNRHDLCILRSVNVLGTKNYRNGKVRFIQHLRRTFKAHLMKTGREGVGLPSYGSD